MARREERGLILTLETGMRVKRGFTLIEILIVIIIIGIVSSIALLAFGDFGKHRAVKMAAEHLVAYIKLIQHQAILENTNFGLVIESRGYHAVHFGQNRWQAVNPHSSLRSYSFPENTLIHLQTRLQNGNLPIMIYSSGELTPFQLSLGTSHQATVITIIGDSQGELRLQST